MSGDIKFKPCESDPEKHIIVYVEGGVVQSVCIPSIFPGVRVAVSDLDNDGADPADLVTDDAGPFYETFYDPF